jgi:hypothetical protein
LSLCGIHELLVYADDVNLLGDTINTIKGDPETLLEASRDIGLEIYAEKTKYIIISSIELGTESFENVAEFKYLGTTLTNQNDIRDEIKRRLYSRNDYYYSVQNLSSSRVIKKT